jgi:Alanine dehydrogenase/PNT, N-terminal domain
LKLSKIVARLSSTFHFLLPSFLFLLSMYRLRQAVPRHQTRSVTTIALRRESKSRWERRVALTPQGVESLIKETGAKVLVQPSTNRVYNEQQYIKVGSSDE